MTYGELAERLIDLTPEQLNTVVTVEVCHESECYPAELRITDTEHDILDENHPVIYII